jgi:hypothetical protein
MKELNLFQVMVTFLVSVFLSPIHFLCNRRRSEKRNTLVAENSKCKKEE